MADYAEVTFTGNITNATTAVWFVLASTTGGTTTYTLLGSATSAVSVVPI